MNTKTSFSWFVAIAMIMAVSLVLRQVRVQAVVTQCDGQPYGTLDCPTKEMLAKSSPVIDPKLCGNYLPDPVEECDEGRFNGSTGRRCTSDCKSRSCGDGI